MSRLTALRVARWARKGTDAPEYPHLEALVEQESAKMKDGFHYARWIVPLVGLFFAVACFLPLAVTVNPLFWIGSAGMLLLGGGLGWIFHLLASQISPTQLMLRKRCLALSGRMVSFGNLLGLSPSLSPKVAATLEEAAEAYMTSMPTVRPTRANGLWAEATLTAHRAMDEAMAQMLRLAEPETPQAQEVELARGWARPMLQEMKATAATLARATPVGGQVDQAAASLQDLADARANLERLGSAAVELEETVHEQA